MCRRGSGKAVTDLWSLPSSAVLDGGEYPHRTDFREILKLMGVLSDERRPARMRWLVALAYFYLRPVPPELEEQAMGYLSEFLTCGREERPGPRLLDWQTDAAEIIDGVNAAAGQEVRSLAHLHWWSFLSWFHSIREGSLSMLVSLRRKLSRGEKLEPYEQDYYRRNRDKVRMTAPPTPEEEADKRRLEEMLSS